MRLAETDHFRPLIPPVVDRIRAKITWGPEMRARKAEDMSELDRPINSCLMPGFAGRSLPEWTARALEEGLAGVCLYGANLPPEGGATAAVAANA